MKSQLDVNRNQCTHMKHGGMQSWINEPYVYFASKDYNPFAKKKNFIERNVLTKYLFNY